MMPTAQLTPPHGEGMAQFSQKTVMGTIFETTQRYTDWKPIGLGVSGLVWYCSLGFTMRTAGTDFPILHTAPQGTRYVIRLSP
jgi:hypothetical protein